MKKTGSLKKLLMSNFLLVSILPLIIVGFISLHVLSSTISWEIEHKNLVIAKSIAGEVEQFLNEPFSLLGQVASVMSDSHLAVGGHTQEYLELLIHNYDLFEMIQIINPSGQLLYMAPFQQDYIGNDMRGQDVFQATFNSPKKAHWSDPFISISTGKPTISLGRKFPYGVIVGYLNLESLSRITNRVHIGEEGFVMIVDAHGTTLAHPNFDYVTQRWNLIPPDVLDPDDSGSQSHFIFTLDGIPSVGTVATVSQTGWKVVLFQPVATAFASLYKIRAIVISGIVFAIILAFLIAGRNLRQVMRPIIDLEKNTRKIAAGNYCHFEFPETWQELNQLATHFEKMVQAIKEREDALKESEALKRAILDGIRINLAFVNRDLEIVWANKASADSVNMNANEITGRRCHELWADPDTPCPGCPTVKAFETLTTQHCIMHTPDGKVWDEKGEPVFDENGQLMGVLEIAQDITESYNARKTIQEREQRLREVVENMPVMLNAFDNAMKVVAWNRECERVTGYSASEIIGRKDILALLYPDKDYREKMKTEVHRMNMEYRNMEWELTAKDGTQRTVAWSCIAKKYPIPGWYIWAVGIDITERIQAMRQKQQLEKRLQQAAKMEAIGTLTGGIAHDFNNILSIIIGNTELAAFLAESNAKIRSHLDAVLAACFRAREVIFQLLTFSRQTSQEAKPLKLAPVIRETLKLLRATIPASIEIHTDISTTQDTIMADATQMHQILLNLCNNAVHAMGNLGGHLELKLENQVFPRETIINNTLLGPGKYVRLTVGDTGTGIDPKIMDRIFDPYFTTKPFGQGTGMGLAVLLGIVKHFHGAVSVNSQLGKGTRFDIYLPVAESEEEPEVKHPPANQLLKGSERILFVDDEPFIANAMGNMLQQLGYTVRIFTDPVEALTFFQESFQQVDLVITDMTMPKISGDRLAQEILAIRPDIPIILCTGYSHQSAMERTAHMGIQQILSKPFTIWKLSRVIRDLLDKKPNPEP